MNIKDLEPKGVWKFFYEITRIPRPSRHEDKIIEYIERVAAEHKIALKKDEAGNLLLSVPAVKGYESLPAVVLQAHLDMVCNCKDDVKYDPYNDPINTVIDGEWVRADGTTLGADNGIGVAAALAVITADDIPHGPVECLFTTDEETGLNGANSLKEGFMTGKILLNLDSEDEGQLFIGCAGGKNTTATFKYAPEKNEDFDRYCRIVITNLKGGHSGCDIDRGTGNAIKILARFLYRIQEKYDFHLAEIKGGEQHNAIPRYACAVIGATPENSEKIRAMLNIFTADIENELKQVDPDVKITMETVEKPEICLPKSQQKNLIYALLACPHGVIEMSHAIEGLVETSTNLASVKMAADNKVVIVTSQRSSTESSKNAVADQVAAVFKLAGAAVEHSDGYPGWKPNPDSEILKTAQAAYRKLFGKDAEIKAIHAGLECGLFLEKYPWLDMISFGPTLRGVHTPAECIEIKTVGMWWEHLKEILLNLKI